MAKPTAAGNVDLETLTCLARLSHCIEKHGKLTLTTLRKSHGFSDPTLESAVKYGSKHKYIKVESYNYVSNVKPYVVPEAAYYEAVRSSLVELWRSDGFSDDQFYIEETASRDSKIVGPWTRPDLTLVSHKKFPWTIGVEFDVVTFEIKRPETSNVLAVFEALSHSSVATKAYVVFPMTLEAWESQSLQQAQRVRDECSRHGVGLIMVDCDAAESRALRVTKALRRDISHERCSNFLEAVVSPDGRAKIAGWK